MHLVLVRDAFPPSGIEPEGGYFRGGLILEGGAYFVRWCAAEGGAGEKLPKSRVN